VLPLLAVRRRNQLRHRLGELHLNPRGPTDVAVTVETHLAHSYQKLGIDSRAQLAGALSVADASGRAR
jgi:hypothetical protein